MRTPTTSERLSYIYHDITILLLCQKNHHIAVQQLINLENNLSKNKRENNYFEFLISKSSVLILFKFFLTMNIILVIFILFYLFLNLNKNKLKIDVL